VLLEASAPFDVRYFVGVTDARKNTNSNRTPIELDLPCEGHESKPFPMVGTDDELFCRVSRGDKTAIALFIASVRGREAFRFFCLYR
jgi:hypothetical protein